MKRIKEYTEGGHRVKIEVSYPIDNWVQGSVNPASPDIVKARLFATIDGTVFQDLIDDIAVVQARATAISADITTTIATHTAQLALLPAFNTALDAALYNAEIPN